MKISVVDSCYYLGEKLSTDSAEFLKDSPAVPCEKRENRMKSIHIINNVIRLGSVLLLVSPSLYKNRNFCRDSYLIFSRCSGCLFYLTLQFSSFCDTIRTVDPDPHGSALFLKEGFGSGPTLE